MNPSTSIGGCPSLEVCRKRIASVVVEKPPTVQLDFMYCIPEAGAIRLTIYLSSVCPMTSPNTTRVVKLTQSLSKSAFCVSVIAGVEPKPIGG